MGKVKSVSFLLNTGYIYYQNILEYLTFVIWTIESQGYISYYEVKINVLRFDTIVCQLEFYLRFYNSFLNELKYEWYYLSQQLIIWWQYFSSTSMYLVLNKPWCLKWH